MVGKGPCNAIPLKEIAYLKGFNTYLNFYKAFKKKFKYAPNQIGQINGNEADEE